MDGRNGVAERILRLRAAHGWTMADLAERMGVKKSTISRWESGHTMPRAVHMVRIEALEEA
jgi:transcriptional regulator with XRE-family HTH domain